MTTDESNKITYECILCKSSNLMQMIIVIPQSELTKSNNRSSNRFATINDLKAHISIEHLNYTPFECDRCSFIRFPTVSQLRAHWRFIHNIDDNCIVNSFFHSFIIILYFELLIY